MKKTLRISFNGKTFLVEAEVLGEDESPSRSTGTRATAAAAAASTPVAAPTSAPLAAAGAGDVPSPLAGKVVSIDAKVGSTVKAGDAVVTLEAMKMNTVVSAPVGGTVAAVHVNPGDSVEEGQVLMTLK